MFWFLIRFSDHFRKTLKNNRSSKEMRTSRNSSELDCKRWAQILKWPLKKWLLLSYRVSNPGLLGRRRPSAYRPSVHLFMWTPDQNLGSDRPSHRQIRTLDQDYNFELDEWTDSDDEPLKIWKCGRRWTGGQMDENPFLQAWVQPF